MFEVIYICWKKCNNQASYICAKWVCVCVRTCAIWMHMWMSVCLFVRLFLCYVAVGLPYFLFHVSRLPNPICCVWISVDIHLASCCAPDLNRSAIIIAFKHEIATATAITYVQLLLGTRPPPPYIPLYIWALSQCISMDKAKPSQTKPWFSCTHSDRDFRIVTFSSLSLPLSLLSSLSLQLQWMYHLNATHIKSNNKHWETTVWITHNTCPLHVHTSIYYCTRILMHTDSAFLISILMPILNVLLFFLTSSALCLYHHNDLSRVWGVSLCLSSKSVHKIRLRPTLYLIIMFTFYVFICLTVCHSAVSGGLCFVFQSKCILRRMQSHKKCTLYFKYVEYIGVCNTLLIFCGAPTKKTIPFWLLPSMLDCRWLFIVFTYIQRQKFFKLIFVGGNFSRYYQNKMILLLIIMRSVLSLDWLPGSVIQSLCTVFFTAFL